ncbi:STAS domain-containing protein [Flavilitoribacter nigricans]|uniref:Anti-anti-sigma factor n=1 Tax=Flavilitoribacter nigricans (strain ATCC 23147 / DSM 23189 / NBRC 102662 / NCIMB 1420 / SS-2) TaxID=1122177 RepID=A0A2D0MXC1_FLAN2|nr:STAS domain-containing protein [Flavilitoribacter nigricans]PHN00904.1 anti-anti-sigma factor [Flavilitoribacter nigricans DSM 23189 = NBRC 102662]
MSEGKMEKNRVVFSQRKIGGESPIIINELIEGGLYSSFFGTLDSARIKNATDLALELINSSEADLIIIDLTNVDMIDTAISMHLVQFVKILSLVGVDVIFCGIQPIVAQAMVSAGVEISDRLHIVKNLKLALLVALQRKGMKVIPIES